jgi:GT2 family glycosyltransferase
MISEATTSIVICVYTEERWDDILAAVASCETQVRRPDQIVIVVDHNPILLQRLSERFPACVVVPNQGPRGLSGGRNTGIACSSTELVAFLDDDATADPHWLAILTDHCRRPDVLGAGSRVEPNWVGAKPRWFPDEFLWTVGCTYVGTPEGVTPVRNLMGGCMCVRRTVFDAIGGFHTELGRGAAELLLSCEETELCIRANQRFQGCHFVYDPGASIRHRVPAHRLSWKYLRSRCYAEGVSKAFVATLTGSRDGLSRERAYALQVLPRGMMRGFADAILGRDVWGIARAAAIGFGFSATVFGYLRGKVRFRRAERRRARLTEAA